MKLKQHCTLKKSPLGHYQRSFIWYITRPYELHSCDTLGVSKLWLWSHTGHIYTGHCLVGYVAAWVCLKGVLFHLQGVDDKKVTFLNSSSCSSSHPANLDLASCKRLKFNYVYLIQICLPSQYLKWGKISNKLFQSNMILYL